LCFAAKVIDAFKFFPTFLLTGYLAYFVTRWRTFLELAFTVRGALEDVGVFIGGAVINSESEVAKEFLYRMYRYLMLLMFFSFEHQSPWLHEVTLEDLIGIGLLHEDESRLLVSVASAASAKLGERVRDYGNDVDKATTVLAWISAELQQAAFYKVTSGSFPKLLGDMRKATLDFHHSFIINQPNLWATLMKFVVDSLVFLYVLSAPFTAFLFEAGCMQPFVFFSTFFLCLPYLCSSTLLERLNTPFPRNHDSHNYHDVYNLDGLMCSTEKAVFSALRVQLDRPMKSIIGAPAQAEKESDKLKALALPIDMDVVSALAEPSTSLVEMSRMRNEIGKIEDDTGDGDGDGDGGDD